MCTQMVQHSALHAQMAYNSAMCTHGRVCIDVCIMVVIHSLDFCGTILKKRIQGAQLHT